MTETRNRCEMTVVVGVVGVVAVVAVGVVGRATTVGPLTFKWKRPAKREGRL